MPIPYFTVRKNLPPEMRNLPLDFLRNQNWAVWPYKIDRGFREYPTRREQVLLPYGTPSALGAMQMITDAAMRLKSFYRGVPDPVGDMVRNASMALMCYNRSDRRTMTEIWSKERALRELEKGGFGWPRNAFDAYRRSR